MPKKAKAGKKDAKGKKGKGKKTQAANEQKDLKPQPALEQPVRPEDLPLAQPMAMLSIFTLLGDYKTILRLLQSAFQVVDRVCLDTPWGKYVIFEMQLLGGKAYCVFDGCVCNPMRFRYFNLAGDKSDMVFFRSMHEMLKWLIMAQRHHGHCTFQPQINMDELCYKESMKNYFLPERAHDTPKQEQHKCQITAGCGVF